ncbi:MAG: DEAD/DEAH box helicase [Actinomycetota bacterium]|nr:MAG: DEAD/DEAH box helicase [Actinomycetota bacterium]
MPRSRTSSSGSGPRRGRPGPQRTGTRRGRPPGGPTAAPRPTRTPLVTRQPQPPVASFAAAGLPPKLVTALSRKGIDVPFPVQAATLPDALAGADVLGRASTGSGKTLGFGLPTLARLAGGSRTRRRPRALVMLPTRELARQVADTLEPLAHVLGLRIGCVYGGAPIGRQMSMLDKGIDLLVATPGRLVDLLERRAVTLDDVQIVVLDEADHLCDLGFLPVMRRLLDLVPAGGQRLLFSATLDGDVDVLVRRYLAEPVLVDVAPADADAPGRVEYRVLDVASREQKPGVVAQLARQVDRTLIFVRTKHGADRLAKQLDRIGTAARALHGGMAQPARTRSLAAFADGSVPVLVATDVAARGIHVDDLALVIHLDPPAEAKTFAHRSGRTGRAGASGSVVSLVCPDERRLVARLHADAGVTVEGS